MKKSFVLIVCLLSIYAVFAQKNPHTLVGQGVEFVSGFGAFNIGFTRIDGNVVTMLGGEGAILINNSFYIGGYGMGMSDDLSQIHVHPIEGPITYNVDFAHGGAYMGYMINTEGLIHFGLSTKVGWGNVWVHKNIFFEDDNLFPNNVNDGMLIVNPQAEVELNVANWCRINFGAGYQLTNGIANRYYTDSDFSGVNYQLKFMFGWFR